MFKTTTLCITTVITANRKNADTTSQISLYIHTCTQQRRRMVPTLQPHPVGHGRKAGHEPHEMSSAAS